MKNASFFQQFFTFILPIVNQIIARLPPPTRHFVVVSFLKLSCYPKWLIIVRNIPSSLFEGRLNLLSYLSILNASMHQRQRRPNFWHKKYHYPIKSSGINKTILCWLPQSASLTALLRRSLSNNSSTFQIISLFFRFAHREGFAGHYAIIYDIFEESIFSYIRH